MALSQTVNAIATGQIELKHAKAILYGLQLAAQNIKAFEAHPELAADPAAMVQSVVHSDDFLDLAPPTGTASIFDGTNARIEDSEARPTRTAVTS